jgi:hypothetical protein
MYAILRDMQVLRVGTNSDCKHTKLMVLGTYNDTL